MKTEGLFGTIKRGLGRGLVKGMPYFLIALAFVGTAAMIWVGGGIIVHGLESYGLGWIAHTMHDAGKSVAASVGVIPGFVAWTVEAAASGVVGLIVGAIAIPVTSYVLSPLWASIKTMLPRRASA